MKKITISHIGSNIGSNFGTNIEILLFLLLLLIVFTGCTPAIKMKLQGPPKPVATDMAGYWKHVESRSNPKPLNEEWFIRANGTGVQCDPSASPVSDKLIVTDYAHIVVNNIDFKIYRDSVNTFFAMNKQAKKTLYFKRAPDPSDACKTYFKKKLETSTDSVDKAAQPTQGQAEANP